MSALDLLRELVDTLPKCQQCSKRPATHGIHRSQPEACVEHVLPGVDTEQCAWAGAIEKAAVAIAAPTVPISSEELEDMRHAIAADSTDAKVKRIRKYTNRKNALEAGYRDPWRNHYVADAGSPAARGWGRLVSVGLAESGKDGLFTVTEAGRERLLELAKARLMGGGK